MTKDITIQINEDLHREIVSRAGGPRKISKFLVPIIQKALTNEDLPNYTLEALQQEVKELRKRVDVLEEKCGSDKHSE